jgi:diacylglycerol kinase
MPSKLLFPEAPARAGRPDRHPARLRAWRGLKRGVRAQANFFAHFFYTAVGAAAALVLRCGLVEWCLLLGCAGLALTAELFRSALEALVRGLPDGGPSARARAGRALDMAAGAALLASLTAGAVGGLVLLSRLAALVGGRP